MFREITPLLGNHPAFRETNARMADLVRDLKIDASIAAPLAIELDAAFIPVRKPGKLTYDKHS